MKLEDTAIYPFIKDRPSLCELYHYEKGSYVVRASDTHCCVYYLIDGNVKVIATSVNGKSFLVDDIIPDNFVGHLSNYYGKNFYCDSIAKTNSSLVRMPIEIYNKMMQDMAFSRLFFFKTSCRLYDMYKNDLVRHLFTQKQQLAYYIMNNTKDNICRIKNLTNIGEILRISRRNLYYLVDGFVNDGILSRNAAGDIVISDQKAINELERPVRDFCENNPGH